MILISRPPFASSSATALSVRTTPLTCGNQASVTMTIRTRRLHNVYTQFRPLEDLESPIIVLDEGGAAFDPVAVVQIVDVFDHAVVGCVDVATNDALGAALTSLAHDSVLEVRDEL